MVIAMETTTEDVCLLRNGRSIEFPTQMLLRMITTNFVMQEVIM